MNVIFSKYNSKGSSKTTINNSSSISSSSSNSEFENIDKSSINRILWGNQDDGDNINESMWVNGNIHLGEWEIQYDEDEDGETDEENPIYPTDDGTTGNIYATGKIEADSVYGKTLYLDYPERKTDNSNKTDVLDILKSHDSKLSEHETKINQNATNITNINTSITNLNTRVTNAEEEIVNIEEGITNIYEILDGLQNSDDNYDSNAPIILFSGKLMSSNGDNSSANYRPFNPSAYSNYNTGVKDLSISYVANDIPTLKITVIPKDGYTVIPSSVNATVMKTSDYNVATAKGGNWRSVGYWVTGGVDTDNSIYLQAWRTRDENNDSATCDCMAWRVQTLNLTIYGRCFRN